MNRESLQKLINELETKKEEIDHKIFAYGSNGYISSKKNNESAFCDTFPRERAEYMSEEQIIRKYGNDESRNVARAMIESLKEKIISHYEIDDNEKEAVAKVNCTVLISYDTARKLDFVEPIAKTNDKIDYEICDLMIVKMGENNLLISYKNLSNYLNEYGFKLEVSQEQILKKEEKLMIKLEYKKRLTKEKVMNV